MIEERREFVQNLLEEIRNNAMKIDCWYTTVVFISPISKKMESRTTYSEHQIDASTMATYFRDTYQKWHTPYYVYSSAYDSNYDGGFFDDCLSN